MKTPIHATVHAEVLDLSIDVSESIVRVACAAVVHVSQSTDSPIPGAVDALIVRAARGDRQAIADVATRVAPILVKEARSVLGPFEDEAEDVVQDVLLALLERHPDLGPQSGRALIWLKGAARYQAARLRDERERAWGLDEDDERED